MLSSTLSAGSLVVCVVNYSAQQWASAVRNDHEGPRLIVALVLQKRGTMQQVRCKRRFPDRRPKLRHWLCLEQLPALSGRPPGPPLGLLSAGAIGRNSSSRIHLPVEL